MRRSKRDLLNARSYIEHALLVAEAYQKYGKCPAVDSEMATLRLFGKAIIRKHDERRGAGNRKDLYVGTRYAKPPMRTYECWVPIAPEVERQRITAGGTLAARRLMAERVGCDVIDVVAVWRDGALLTNR